MKLVTGATGFVGGHLARTLLRNGEEVRVLVRRLSNEITVAELKNIGASIVYGDVTDISSVNEAVQGCDAVFHIAAVFREAKFPDQYYFNVNAGGTKNILDASVLHGVKRVLHCSTNGVHGGSYTEPINEEAPFAPSDVYQESKVAAEAIAQQFHEAGKVEVVIIRPGMIWGEGDFRFRKMFRGISRRRLPIIGSGKTWTHWSYVHDLVESFILAERTPGISGQAYLIAGERRVTLEHVYQTIASLAGVNVLPFRVPALPLQLAGDAVESVSKRLGIEPFLHRRRVDFFVKNRCFDTTRVQTELGYRPKQSFEEEASRIFHWYRENNYL